MNNFESLYSSNYELFWAILHDSAERAGECRSKQDVENFLELGRIRSKNAEFNEFFSETIEGLAVKKTECLLSALAKKDMHLQGSVSEKLLNPIFVESGLIEKKLKYYRNNTEYGTFMGFYFR